MGWRAPPLIRAAGTADDADDYRRPPLAPTDFTGYWVAVVTEDWRWRMMTPLKGDVSSIPVNAEGKRAAEAWDPAKDLAAGEQCRAYGAAGIMRMPVRLHVTWQDENTLKVDIDNGTQTRLLVSMRTPSLRPRQSGRGFRSPSGNRPPKDKARRHSPVARPAAKTPSVETS